MELLTSKIKMPGRNLLPRDLTHTRSDVISTNAKIFQLLIAKVTQTLILKYGHQTRTSQRQ
jgi:hypothetical protein